MQDKNKHVKNCTSLLSISPREIAMLTISDPDKSRFNSVATFVLTFPSIFNDGVSTNFSNIVNVFPVDGNFSFYRKWTVIKSTLLATFQIFHYIATVNIGKQMFWPNVALPFTHPKWSFLLFKFQLRPENIFSVRVDLC